MGKKKKRNERIEIIRIIRENFLLVSFSVYRLNIHTNTFDMDGTGRSDDLFLPPVLKEAFLKDRIV